MKKWIPFLLVLVLLAGCAASAEQEKNSYRQISMEEAVTMMEEESDYIILDVRTEEEYCEKHIPDAINIPNETIGSGEIEELPDKDQLILVYCRSGNRSKQAAEKLTELGYTNIVEFGGINDWTGETVSGSHSTTRILEENGYDAYNFSGGFGYYDAVMHDRCLIETATA